MWKILLPIIVAYFLYTNFLYIDFSQNCNVIIQPSLTPSNWNAHEIINIVKQNDLASYKLFCSNVSYLTKEVQYGCPYVDGGCYNPSKKNSIYIGNDMDNSPLTAAILVHEICHLKQGIDKRPFDEPECYEKNAQFLKDIQKY